jgi:hypothetical protein
MTYDYKRLCDELLSYLYQCDWPDGERFYALTERARTALAEPSPPSLKEQALIELNDVYNRDKIDDVTYDTIRRALEHLDD